jgi:spore germination protein KA
MLHRRLRTANLKIETLTVGRQTRTRLALVYMENLVKRPVLDELIRRLSKIDIDGILDSNPINELIRDNRWSPFRASGMTERPDTAAAKMMEGRIVLLTDGSPVALTLPYLFSENFSSSEDYYVSFLHASFARLLRIAAFLLTALTPALYICVAAFHYEILPGKMILNMAEGFQHTPFPASFETFFMLVVFDVLRETGMRMSANGGQALSIVGALIIGQAAVAARIVSPQMIIVVAVTGITGLIVPKLDEACLYIRFFLLFCASALGLFGFTAGAALVLIHTHRLRSLGVPQIGGSSSDWKDSLIRAPYWTMTERPSRLTDNRRRMKL